MNLRLIAVIPFLATAFAACAVQPADGTQGAGPEAAGQTAEALPAGAQTWSWGGGYQIDDCWRNSVPNPLNNNQYGCGVGFRPIYVGRQLDPESGCGGQKWQCVSDGFQTSKSFVYGGMFQIDDCGTNNVVNPEANYTLGCPGGFTRSKFARVKAPESNCGATQYLCSMTPGAFSFSDPNFDKRRFGGAYQVDDCGQNNVNNPLTGGTWCPAGYNWKLFGRAKAAEGSQCGMRQIVCEGT